jgi:hypothetical protein
MRAPAARRRPAWPRFDAAQLPSIMQALALRGRERANATSTALSGEFEPSEFQGTVSHGWLRLVRLMLAIRRITA